MPLRFAFCTDDTLVGAELHAAIDRLADHGWDGVAVGFDPGGHLDPRAPDLTRRIEELGRHLERRALACAVSLAPLAGLVSSDSEARAAATAVLRTAVEVAGALGAEAVAFGPGPASDGPEVDLGDAWCWLVDGCEQLVEGAEEAGVEPCLEPVPGSVVPSSTVWAAVHDDVPGLRLGLDLGACLLPGGEDPTDAVARWAPHLGAAAISDVDPTTAEAVAPGAGQLELHRTLAGLTRVGYANLVRVRLPLGGDRSPEASTAALNALRAAELSIQVGH
jgi:ribosomal protein S12 methylthiotransferase accessory factor